VGPQFGGVVKALLSTPAVTGALADALGATVTNFLAYPGFNTALVAALNLLAGKVLSGTDVSAALSEVVASLQADRAFQAAVNGVIPTTVATLLGPPGVRQAIGSALSILTVELLQQSGTPNFVDSLAGRIAGAAAQYLLGRQAAWNLVATLLEDILIGKIGATADDILGLVTRELLAEPGLQVAVGLSIGAGIGFGLFGDNIVGYFVFLTTGATMAVVTVAVAQLVNIYLGISRFVAPSPAASQSGNSHFFRQVSMVSDRFQMNATVPMWQEADGIRSAAATVRQRGLSALKIEIGETASDFVSVSMSLDVTASHNGPAEPAPLLVDFKVPFDLLFPARGPALAAARNWSNNGEFYSMPFPAGETTR
jgi:hypothetical protein